ncbi:MAG: hypothetical protein ACOX6C_01550 [Patescibacteria group bacterium]|jgi:hypothetical protein
MSKSTIKSLAAIVTEALDFFETTPPPYFDPNQFVFPLVVGSGNAYHTGKILFAEKTAIYANESDFDLSLKRYESLIKNGTLREAVVISASGEKDSIYQVEAAQTAGLKTTLLTCSAESGAAKIADQVKAYRKIAEPYTYNFSTYCGLILSAGGEKVTEIKKALAALEIPKNFGNYKAYSFILPNEFSGLVPMLDIKRHELFGPKLSLRAFTFSEARHAKFVIRDPKELVISFGANDFFGDPGSRWKIDLPEAAGYALMMSLTYYLVGKIQESQPDYFRQNIERFCQEDGPRAYGSKKPFTVIVPGN